MGSIDLQPGSGSLDTYMADTAPTADYGSSTSVYVGLKTGKATTIYRALFYFDCSSIPSNSIVTSATFTTWNASFTDDTDSKPCTAYIARKVFTADANWNTYDGSTDWATAGGDYNLTPSSSFDLTAGQSLSSSTFVDMVQHAVTNQSGALRMLIKADDETATQGWAQWKSMNHVTTGQRPRLEVNYTARIQWTGNTDGDAETASNWSPEVVPTAGDIAQFATGSNPCTTGTITCGTLTIASGYIGDIGTSSSPVSVNATKVVINKRNGNVHLSLADVNADVYIDGTPAGTSSVSLAGDIGNLYAITCGGQVQVSAAVGTVYMIPSSRKRAAIKLSTDAGDPDVIAKGQSDLVTPGELDSTHVWGGAKVTANDELAQRMGAVKLRDGGLLKYNGNDSSSTLGFESTVTLYGGELSLKDSSAPSITFTGTVKTYADSILNTANGVDAAEFASAIEFYGGRIRLDSGMKATSA